MSRRRTAGAVALAAALALGVAAVAPASASGGTAKVEVVADGLTGPFGLDALGGGGFLTAESFSGEVTRVDPQGKQHTLIANAAGVSGVAKGPRHLFAVLGGPDELGQPPQGDYPAATVIRSDLKGKNVKVLKNLLTYELNHNPDGQKQFVDGEPPDTLSNPFSVNRSKYGLLIADGAPTTSCGSTRSRAHVTPFFVPPTVKDVKACLEPGAQANPGTVGCDPVPTGHRGHRRQCLRLHAGRGGSGCGRVYRLDPRTGKVRHVWKGLTAPTGIAISPSGAIYVSEVLEGAPEGDEPPPGFDPSTVGRITKIANGKRTHAQVTMPTGLDFRGGDLYSTAWSVALSSGSTTPGQIVKVKQSAFH